MTLNELIEQVTVLRGQQYATETIVSWINEIEGEIIDEVVNRAEGNNVEFKPLRYETDSEKELTLPARFQDIYTNYILSKIDFNNQETERYNNDVVMFNSAYAEYAAWYRRNHVPKPGSRFKKM